MRLALPEKAYRAEHRQTLRRCSFLLPESGVERRLFLRQCPEGSRYFSIRRKYVAECGVCTRSQEGATQDGLEFVVSLD
jgi:hypothetical protein